MLKSYNIANRPLLRQEGKLKGWLAMVLITTPTACGNHFSLKKWGLSHAPLMFEQNGTGVNKPIIT
jgi:hypothetical protein